MKREVGLMARCCGLLVIVAVAVSLYGCNDVSSVSTPPPPPSPDSQLSSLAVSPGTLQPAFSSTVTSYTVDVLTTVTSVTVTVTPQDANATMTINGQATPSGQPRAIALGGPGSSTPISIVVIAPNGNQATYVVTVNRPASSDNNLSALSVTGQTLNPGFSPSELNYTVNVASTVANVTVSATKVEPNAVMSGAVNAAAGVASGQATITLNGPGNITPISITVTAPNGSSRIYTINVNRAALGGDNNLSALSVTGQTLVPTFDPAQISYTVAVGANVTSVQVTATKSDPLATITGSLTAGSGVATAQATIPLGGQGTGTPVSIVVTAQNGNPKTYTVIVNRGLPLSNNNNLSNLVLSAGALIPAFAQATTSYTVSAPNTTITTTVTATVAAPTATLTINGSAAISGVASGPIALSVGNNPIPVVVTAQDGTPKTYTVIVNRAAAATSPLTITTNSLPEGRRNQAYSATLAASGGIPRYTWSVTPTLPAGLTLGAATGVISGTPTVTGNDEFDFTVRDSANQTRTKELDLRIRS